MKNQLKRISVMLAVVLTATIFTACASNKSPSSSVPASVSNQSSQAVSDKDGQMAETSAAKEPFKVNFDTVDLEGGTLNSDSFADYKLTVLNIWGTWCPPCVKELPELQKVSETYADKKVRLIGMLQDGVTDKLERDDTIIANAKTLMENAGATYTVLLPDEVFHNEILSHIQSFPTTLFIDEKGELVYAVQTALPFEKWSEVIDKVLEAMET